MATYIWGGGNSDWQNANNWLYVYYVAPNGDQYYEAATVAPGLDDQVEFLPNTGHSGVSASITGAVSVGFLGVDAGYDLTLTGATVSAGTIDSLGVIVFQNNTQASANAPLSSVAVYTQNAGQIFVEGAGTTLSATSLAIGLGGSLGGGGYLDVTGGATVDIDTASEFTTTFGVGDGGSGSALVTGEGTSLTETGGVATIGFDATGSLTISAGAAVTLSQSDDEQVALAVGLSESGVSSNGVVTVTGDDSSLTTTEGVVQIGNGVLDTASLNILAGAQASLTNVSDVGAPTLVIGDDDSTGTVKVSGPGSVLTITGGVQISNHEGLGTLEIDDAAVVSILDPVAFQVGLGFGSNGKIVLAGQGSTLTTNTGAVQIGDISGNGELDVLGGSSATFTQTSDDAPTLVIGDDDSTGLVNVSGARSTLTTNSGGVQISNHGGRGTLDISYGGAVDIVASDPAPDFEIGLGEDSSGTVSVDDATLTVDPLVSIGAAGGAGSLTVFDDAVFSASAGLVVGDDPSTSSDQSTFALADDATASTGSVTFGFDAEADGEGLIASDAKLTVSGLMTVGDAGIGALTLIDGADLTVTGDDPEDQFALSIGEQAGSQGSLTLDDASLTISAGGVVVANDGDGSLTIDGGSVFDLTGADATFTIGAQEGADGGVLIKDDGVLSLSGTDDTLVIGDSSGATGTLTLYGEEAALAYDGPLTVGDDGTGEFDLESGATWSTTQNVTIAAGDDSSGVIYVGGVDEDTGELVDGDGAELSVDDLTVGDQGRGALYISDDATVEVAGVLVIGNDDTANGTVTLSGSDSVLDYDNTLIVGDDGVGKLSLVDDAVFTLADDDILAGANFGGSGTIDVAGGSSLTVGSLTIGNWGEGVLTVGVDDSEEEDAGETPTIGATVDVIGNLFIGMYDDSVGAVTVNTGSTLTVGGDLDVGYQGAGSLDIAGDVLVDDATNIGFQPGATDADGQPTTGGEGQVTIFDGGDFVADDDVFIGRFALTSGELDVTGVGDGGTPSTFTYGETMTVGDDGVGVLTIDDDGLVTFAEDGSGDFNIGARSGGEGTVTVDGSGSTLETQDLTVGGSDTFIGGTGTLNVETGGLVSVLDDLVLGESLQSSGTLNVTGFGDNPDDPSTPDYSQVDYGGTLTVGESGQGALNVSDGGGVVVDEDGGAGEILIGDDATGVGTVVITGDKSELDGSDLSIGVFGSGSLTVDDGAALSLKGDSTGPATLDIAVKAQSSGALRLAGDDSTMDFDGVLVVGDGGHGAFNVTSGAIWSTSDDIVIAALANSKGAVDVSGANSELDAGAVAVGDDGVGTLTVEGGASASFDGDLILGADQGASGTVNVTGSAANPDSPLTPDSSELDYGGTLAIGLDGTGTLNISDGGEVARPLVGGSGVVEIAEDAGAVGTVTIDGEDSELQGSEIYVGDGGKGSLTIQNGADLTLEGAPAELDIGVDQGGSGTLTLTGADSTIDYSNPLDLGDGGDGALNIKDGAGLDLPNNILVGAQSGATGSIDVTGDSSELTAKSLIIGDDGVGTITVEGGASTTAQEDLIIGDDQQSSGTLDVTGASANSGTPSSVSFGATLTVGAQGSGVLDITQGGDVGPTANGTGAINIGETAGGSGITTVDGDGSELSAATLVVGGTSLQSGGTLNISNGGEVNVTNAHVEATGVVNLAGGVLNSDPIAIDSGGVVFGYGTISGAVTNQGLLAADGGALIVSDAVQGQGSAEISNGGVLTFLGGFNQSVAFVGRGALSLSQGDSATISGFGQDDLVDLTFVRYAASDLAVETSNLNGVSSWNIETASGTVLASLNLSFTGDASERLTLADDETSAGGTDISATVVTGDPGPTITSEAPASVGHGQKVEIATVAPGLSGDVLTLQQTGGGGTLSLSNGVVSLAAPTTGGADALTYTITDEYGDVADGSATIAVDPGPTTASGALTIGHGQNENVDSLIDSLVTPGVAGDTETISAVSATAGTVTLSNGVVTYVAPASGAATINYTVEDQLGDTVTGTIAVTVDPGPTIRSEAPASVGHGQTVEIATVAAGLSGDALTLQQTGGGGTLSLSNGVVSFVAPSTGGADALTYSITDEYGDVADGSATVMIDTGPTTVSGALTIGHGQSDNVTSLIDSLVTPGLAGDTETITAVSATAGTAKISNGVVTYVAPASGAATINYTVEDQLGDTATGTIAVTVDPGPKTKAGKLTIGYGQSENVTSVIDSFVTPGVTGDTETITAVSATVGTATLSNGVVTYVAPASGKATISYTIEDQFGETATGKVAVTVDPGPTITSTAPTLVGHGQKVTIATVAAGISGDTLTLLQTGGSGTLSLSKGVVSLIAPATGGADALTYTITDEYGDVADGSATVTIDTGPTTVSGALTIGHGQSENVTSLIDGLVTPGLAGDTETITAVSATAGTAKLSSGVVTYTAPTSGKPTISYTIKDQLGDTATGTIAVTVDPGPTTKSAKLTIGHGQSENITSLIDSLVTPGLSGDTETLTAVTATAGTATLLSGVVTYVAPASGKATIFYTVMDQIGDTSTGTLAVTVDPGPTITSTAPTLVGHGQKVTIATVAAGISGDTLTLLQTGGSGTLSLSKGVVSLVAPATGGADALTYTITDEYGDVADGSATVTIDTGPTTVSGALTIGHGQSENVTGLIDSLVTPGLAGDTETITAISATAGTAKLSNGVVTYVAPLSGTSTISYTVKDELGDTATGTVAVTVDPGPTTKAGTLTIGHGQSENVTSLIDGLVTPGLTGDAETITAVSATAGTATLSNGAVTYVAPATGKATISYTVTDQLGDTATGKVAVTVDPGPTVKAVSAQVDLNQSINLTSALLAAASVGLNGDTLTIRQDNTTATLGQVSLSNGQLVYTASGSALATIPATGSANDTFSFTIADEYGDTATATATVTATNPATSVSGSTSGGSTIQIANGNVTVTLYGANNVVTGGNGNDVVSGSTGTTTIMLGNGGDTVTAGGLGNVIGLGSGTDTVSASNSTVSFGAGGKDILTGASDTIAIGAGGSLSVNGASDSVTASSNDKLTFTGSNDSATIDGTGDTTSASGTNETFSFQQLFGHQQVTGFEAADTIGLSQLDFASWTALQGHISQSGANTLITLDANDVVTLTDVASSSLTLAQFKFT